MNRRVPSECIEALEGIRALVELAEARAEAIAAARRRLRKVVIRIEVCE